MSGTRPFARAYATPPPARSGASRFRGKDVQSSFGGWRDDSFASRSAPPRKEIASEAPDGTSPRSDAPAGADRALVGLTTASIRSAFESARTSAAIQSACVPFAPEDGGLTYTCARRSPESEDHAAWNVEVSASDRPLWAARSALNASCDSPTTDQPAIC